MSTIYRFGMRRIALSVCAFGLLVHGAAAELKLVSRWPEGACACVDTPLRLTFDSPPKPGARGKIEIVRSSDGAVVESLDFGAGSFVDRYSATALRFEPVSIEGNVASVKLHGHALGAAESYSVRISAGVFTDAEGSPSAEVGEGWNFQTKPAMPRNPERVTVAADGSADYCTVQGAVDQIEPHRDRVAEIFVKRGTYRELVRIGRDRRHVRLVGEDRRATAIVCVNNDKQNPGWVQRAVLGVEADDFTLENMTVQNATPYKGSQAEAIYVNAERCILRNADLLSFQDTLHLTGRVYVSDCYIEGDVDYVWGYGTAVFERCHLHTVHDGFLVQARNSDVRSGYVFLDCKFTADTEVKKLWVARIESARFPFSHVAFIRCAMTPQIKAEGWQISGDAVPTLRFEEFGSTDLDGKPLDLSARVGGKTLSAEEAAERTATKILGGSDGWKVAR
jgi:pectin methylesterase-like acyl-CoA thioesterase